MSYTYQIEYCCVNIKGGVREENQDNFYADGRYRLRKEKDNDIVTLGTLNSDDNNILAIYDGMGGESHGDVASFIAAINTAKFDKIKASGFDMLQKMCTYLNSEICQFSFDNSITCMGTTVALIRFDSKGILTCNLGDSRIFRIDAHRITQISKDHVLDGLLMKKPPLTQYLGIPSDECTIEPYIANSSYVEDDIYLLCSDGITDMLNNEDIFRIVNNENNVEYGAKELVSAALKNGGHDNITVILCRVLQKDKQNFIQKLIKARRE